MPTKPNTSPVDKAASDAPPSPASKSDARLAALKEKRENALKALRQIDSQVKTLETKKRRKEREEKRRLEEHKKYSIGGHFLPYLEPLLKRYAGSTEPIPEPAVTLSDSEFAQLLYAHMRRFMSTAYHRETLGLPSLPTAEGTRSTAGAGQEGASAPANDAASSGVAGDFAKSTG